MKNRLALLVVIAAAIGLVLTGCGRGPGTKPPPTEPPVMPPSIDGTWVFTGFEAKITVPDVTVTVGDGMTSLSEDQTSQLARVAQIMVKGKLTMAGTTYKLALAEGEDAIGVTLVEGTPPVFGSLAKVFIKGLIADAQDGDVDIKVSDDMMMITVKGSFLNKVAETLDMPVPPEGLVGCKGAPCTMGS